MSQENQESFIRWQERSVQQFGFVNNLLIGLSSGFLAFHTQLDVTVNSLTGWEQLLLLSSLAASFLSLAVGCLVAWNRLRSFRLTAQVARRRVTGNRNGIDDLRESLSGIDQRSWGLLFAQTILFALGSLALTTIIATRFLGYFS